MLIAYLNVIYIFQSIRRSLNSYFTVKPKGMRYCKPEVRYTKYLSISYYETSYQIYFFLILVKLLNSYFHNVHLKIYYLLHQKFQPKKKVIILLPFEFISRYIFFRDNIN